VIQIALADMNGNILAKSQKPTEAEQGGEVTCDNIAAGVDEVLAEHHAQGNEDQLLRAVTIGVPGTIDPISSKVVKAPMISGWSDLDLKNILRQRLQPVPLRIENDNNAAAIGEYAVGVAKGVDNFVYASIRRGIGAGIFINGKLYRGSSGFAGEMGKMVWDPNFTFSPTSGLGYLESICAEDAVVKREQQTLLGLAAEDSQRPTMRSISKAAAAGNTQAIEVLTSTLEPLGLAIANIASLLDPKAIVLGGDIHFAMNIAVDGLNQTIGSLIPTPPQVLASSLGDQDKQTYYNPGWFENNDHNPVLCVGRFIHRGLDCELGFKPIWPAGQLVDGGLGWSLVLLYGHRECASLGVGSCCCDGGVSPGR